MRGKHKPHTNPKPKIETLKPSENSRRRGAVRWTAHLTSFMMSAGRGPGQKAMQT